MIVNYHGFFRVHRHHYADHAALRGNYAGHCSNYAGRASDHSCRLVSIVTRARDLRYVGS